MAIKLKQLPPISQDFSKWYVAVCRLAELSDYGVVRGTMVFRPYGYAIWKAVMQNLGKMIEELGVQDAYFPMFIPYSLLQKEAEHVEGFAPEVAVVTHAGGEKLEEPLVVRPTSETIMYAHFKDWVKSYRDLPLLINQWCNVVRWEKRTFPFIRTSEFLWQEGHTAHATRQEAEEFTKKALDMYHTFATQYGAIAGVKGYKTVGEKFAGADYTTTIEVLLKSKKALQLCTSHMLGQNFSKPFEITYLDESNTQQYVWQTSWGLSTRFVGAIIGHHGDDLGLVLPPRLAPVQVVIIPILGKEKSKSQILNQVDILKQMLGGSGIRVKVDTSPKGVGYKFSYWDIKGVPLRIEIGEKEAKEQKITIYIRATREKRTLVFNNHVHKEIQKLLDEVHSIMLNRSKAFMEENTTWVKNVEELEDLLHSKPTPGFIKVYFKDDTKVAKMLQDRYKITPRVVPFDTYDQEGPDFVTGEKGGKVTLFAKAY